ncbi:MAG: Crp/Fnr family transcriptional regulator [Hyphomonadaceae bacterium]|nr:Crp/Fnr family transcriptional regulator [Hyphomonadaceae bacterium]
MSQTVAVAALAQSRLFRALSAEARQTLIDRGGEVRLAPEERLCAKGDKGDALYLILEGEIEVGVTTAGGKQVRFASLGPGDLAGDMAVIDGGARSADLTALRRTRLLRISREALLDTLASEPAALLALSAELVARLRATDALVEGAVLHDLGAKLAQLLLVESGGGVRPVQLTQVEMARRISVSREKLNRKLAALRDEGLLELSRTGVRVCDPAGLEALVRRRGED